MNAERLHAVVKALREEMRSQTTTRFLQSVVSSLSSVVQQSNAQNQQNLASNISNLYSSLDNSASDDFSPTWRQILKEIGGDGLFGARLKERIETSLSKNQITLAVALQELKDILEELIAFDNALNQADSSFDTFKIGSEDLAPGESEIGILIPREAVKNKMLNFAEELKELNFILNTFSEIATGQPADLTLKTISSSDLLVFLDGAVPFAACLAVGIERIVALYKSMLEIRKLHAELIKQGVPQPSIKGIEDHANSLMESGIESASTDIISEFYKNKDKGRKNELTVALRISLNKIANRIDRGYNIEVRCEPPESNDNIEPEVLKAIEIVQKATPNMQFLKLQGKPLLKLPEHEEKPKKTESDDHGKKKDKS